MRSEEIQVLLSPLQTASISDKDVGGILQKIRSDAMATKGGFQRLVKLGCVPLILKLFSRYLHMERSETAAEKVASENSVNTALSIVANLLMDKGARQQVNKFGMETIARLLTHCTSEEVKIRCCRSLSNLSIDCKVHEVMADSNTMTALLRTLDPQEEEEEEADSGDPPETSPKPEFPSCALVEAACKILRYCFCHGGVRQALVEKGVVRRLAMLMKLEDCKLVAAVLRTLAELFTKMNYSLSHQQNSRIKGDVVSSFPRAGVVPKVMNLVDSENDQISQHAFSILLRLSEDTETAALIGKSDGIDFFLSLLDCPRSHITKTKVFTCMCLLAKDSGNRYKLLQANVLKLFLETLQDDALVAVHGLVLCSLSCYRYDDAGLTALLEEGVVTVLLTHLQRCANFTSDFTVSAFKSAQCLFKPAAGLSGGQEENIAAGSLGRGDLGFSGEKTLQDKSGRGLERAQSEPVRLSIAFDVPATFDDMTPVDLPCDPAPSVELPLGQLTPKSLPMEIDSSGPTVRSSSDREDKRKDQPGPAQTQTYSMNSPSYQAEITWRMEDYHPGVTCKSYSSAPSPGSHSEGSRSPSMNPHSPRSPPSYCSPSYSTQFSPLSSLASSSPRSSLTVSPAVSPSTSGDCISLWSSGGDSSEDLTAMGVQQPRLTPDPDQHDSMFTDGAGQGFIFSSSEDDDVTEDSEPGVSSDGSHRSVRKVLFHVGEDGATMGQGPGSEDVGDQAEQSDSEQTLGQGFETGQRFFRLPDSVSEPMTKKQKVETYPRNVQNNILSLLAHLSYRSDHDKHMASYEVLLCLTDYLAFAAQPDNHCMQILTRVMSSQHCVASMLEMCAPAMVVRASMLDSDLRLVRLNDKNTNHHGTQRNSTPRSLHPPLRTSSSGRRKLAEVLAKIGSTLLADLSSQAMSPIGQSVILFTFRRRPAADQLLYAASLLFLQKHWTPERRQKFLMQTGALEKVLSGLCTPRTSSNATIIKDVLGLALIWLSHDLHLTPQYQSEDIAYFLKRALEKRASENLYPGPAAVEESATGCSDGGGESVAAEEICCYSTADKDLKVFVSDGGSRHVLHARREMLVKNSSVFDAMLQGGYLEAQQSEIRVEGVCATAMTTLLHYLHGCDSRCGVLAVTRGHDRVNSIGHHGKDHLQQGTQPCRSASSDKEQNASSKEDWIQHMLNVIVVADRYLLLELVQYLCAVVSASLWDSCCAEYVLEFAVFHGLSELAEDCVLSLLHSPVSVADISSRLAVLAEGQCGPCLRDLLLSLLKKGISLH